VREVARVASLDRRREDVAARDEQRALALAGSARTLRAVRDAETRDGRVLTPSSVDVTWIGVF
jgi:hypothetical protein